MMTINEIQDYVEKAEVKSVVLCRYPQQRRGYFADIEFYDGREESKEITQDVYDSFDIRLEVKHDNVYIKKLTFP